MMKCVYCGAEHGDLKLKLSLAEKWTPQQRAIVELLETSVATSYEAIAMALWGTLPSGGPDNAGQVITTQVCRIRRKLLKHGYRVVNDWSVGYRLEKV